MRIEKTVASRSLLHAALGIVTAIALPGRPAYAAEQRGRVLFQAQAVPGATVVASLPDGTHLETSTGVDGTYFFPELKEGVWSLRIELPGFATMTGTVDVGPGSKPVEWSLKMLPAAEILALARDRQVVVADPMVAISTNPAGHASLPGLVAPAVRASPGIGASSSEENELANDGLLVNGSVNNAATSAFALGRGFGNQRSGTKTLYTGGLAVIADNSAFDARPVALAGVPQPKPSYNKVTEVFTFGGPLNIPHLLGRRSFKGPDTFLIYQRTRDRVEGIETGLVPTAAQRVATDPVAAALLGFYPLPNIVGNGTYNYQTPVLNNAHLDALQLRMQNGLGVRDQLSGSLATQSIRQDSTNLFGFRDATAILGINARLEDQHRLPHGVYLDVVYSFSRLRTQITPFFQNRSNISGADGLRGNLQDPMNWGPPTLLFASGIASLGDAQSAFNRNRSDAVSLSARWVSGKHTTSLGGDVRRQEFNDLSQRDARGTYIFTGAALGSDFADFLAGVPDTASIDYGNADKYLRENVYDAFAADDWRVRPELTINAGLRWEYGAPVTELKQRLANLDVAPNFSAATPVLASAPRGLLTGLQYPSSLLWPDRWHVEPRIGLAWRPLPASTLIVHAGYGVYSDTSVYPDIAVRLAEEAPLANSLSVNNGTCAQTLRTAPSPCAATTATSFAVDPDFRIGYAQVWNLSAQRDLFQGLLITANYTGTKGTHGVQDFLPNTYPLGAENPCPLCPVGFVYRASGGNSTRHAGTLQLRRRLRNGFTAAVDYTYSKSIDDDSMLGGQGPVNTPSSVSLGAGTSSTQDTRSASLAQNWLNLRGERGLSSFDQRHLIHGSVQYTTGQGLGSSALLRTGRARLYNEWTVLLQASIGSGLPETPVYYTAVNGTGFAGSIRPDRTAAKVDGGSPGHFYNAAAFSAPRPGQWGDAGRDSIEGPATYTFNASLARTFRLTKRFNVDARADAFNVLNHVVYSSYDAILNPTLASPLFGVPIAAGPSRSVQLTTRVRF